ncbi:uncharacterized protein LOC117118737 [Anneissia japonica]|uniref:uncharacterized protein LOC117118737 n=1 Tax=Anneissia japonica TaxID=1529436 RepID=UPI001425B745|nr:uncharacterized protein LOC117118737 [Anneissia japonica]
MEKVKFLILLLLFVLCDSSCPTTWYTIPGNRCIKVIGDKTSLNKILDSKLCEKYTIDTKVASYISVTSPNDMAILYNFKRWVQFVYLDWNYDGSTYYYSNGSMFEIDEYSLLTVPAFAIGGCIEVDLSNQEVHVDCRDNEVGYICEMKL